MVGKIKEDVKRDVLRYLNSRIHKRWKVEDFTLSSICEAVNETSDRTENILEKLKEGGSIDSHRVETDIFLPKDKELTEKIKSAVKSIPTNHQLVAGDSRKTITIELHHRTADDLHHSQS